MRSGAQAGLAFDGDADRVMLADEHGEIVDGDRMMAILALDLHRKGRLPGDVVVATIMSNVGLEQALAKENIRLHRTDVGDRYVAEAMETLGAAIGGEQSGHILLPFQTPTGDGLVTALQVLAIVRETGKHALGAGERGRLRPATAQERAGRQQTGLAAGRRYSGRDHRRASVGSAAPNGSRSALPAPSR